MSFRSGDTYMKVGTQRVTYECEDDPPSISQGESHGMDISAPGQLQYNTSKLFVIPDLF